MEVKETVEEAAAIEAYCVGKPADIPLAIRTTFITGANWQKENSIDRDKVIAVIRHYNDNIGIHDVDELIQRIKNI